MRKRSVLFFCVALFVLMIFAQGICAHAEESGKNYRYVLVEPGGYLNIRASPGGDVVDKLWRGKRVLVLEEKDGWFKIDTGKRYGYCAAEYLVDYSPDSVLIRKDAAEMPEIAWDHLIHPDEQGEVFIERIYVSKKHKVLKAYLSNGKLYITSPVSPGRLVGSGEHVVIRRILKEEHGPDSNTLYPKSCHIQSDGGELVASVDKILIQKDFYEEENNNKIYLPMEACFFLTQYSISRKTIVIIQ